ncbi:MAG: 2-oxoacid:acceptor oxidoreductase subunit alpha [Desulfarculus sp.]|nr:2-oxoacid:acceptor oxidoreductase subunit alpha [Desulfarculus sp.]
MPSHLSQPALAPGAHYLSGNEAAAEGALAAGCGFYAGYPITPSSEIMERLAARLPQHGGVFLQMEDEIASLSAVIGAAWAGKKALTATSGPGLSLMQECLGYAAFTETPCVLIDVQRAGPCTGQATKVGAGDIMAAKWGSHGDYQVVALSPWSAQEMFDLTVRAFNWAERLRLPAILLAEEAVGHLRERVDIPQSVDTYQRGYTPGAPPFGHPEPGGVPSMPRFGQGEALMITGSTHDERGFRRTEDPAAHAALVHRLNHKVLARAGELCQTEGHFLEDASLVVLAYGFTARAALKAVKLARRQGVKAGLLRLVTLWPFPEEAVAQALARGARLLVPEMNLGQVAGLARQVVGPGLVRPLSQVDGRHITPATILGALLEMAP